MATSNPSRMSHRWLLCGLALSAAMAFFGGRALSQEATDKKAPPEMDEGMKKMMEASMPGPYHKHLNALVGNWDSVVRFWTAPGGEPQESKATCKRHWILAGRFIGEDHDGTFMNQPFNGFGLTGYDNVIKKYVNTWCDTMGTGIMTSEGTCDTAGKTFNYAGQYNDPMTGKPKKSRSMTRVISDNKHVFEMYDTTPEGKEFKVLEITYTRK